MDKRAEAGIDVRPESVLVVRVELVDSEPEIWRQLDVRGSQTLDQVHQVLQTVFGWEDMHLHRFTADDPFAPLRHVDGEIPEALQWLPAQEGDEPDDRPEGESSLTNCWRWVPAQRFMNTTSETAGCTGLSWFRNVPRPKALRRPG